MMKAPSVLFGLLLLSALPASAATAVLATVAGLPVYPGAVATLPAATTHTFCRHTVTETGFNVGQTSITTIANWYAQRIPGAVRWTMTQNSENDAVAFDPNGARGVNVTHVVNNAHDLAQFKGKGFVPQNRLIFVTYAPALSSASLKLLKAYSTGDKAALSQMKAECATSF